MTIGGVLLLLIAIGVVDAIAGTGDIAKWADVSTIILIVPAMFIGLIVIAVSAGSAYVMTRGWSSAYIRRLQDVSVLIVLRVNKVLDSSTEPFLRLHQFTAGVRALWRRSPKPFSHPV